MFIPAEHKMSKKFIATIQFCVKCDPWDDRIGEHKQSFYPNPWNDRMRLCENPTLNQF